MSELDLVKKVIAPESVELMNRPVDALYVVMDCQMELQRSGEPLDTVGPANDITSAMFSTLLSPFKRLVTQ